MLRYLELGIGSRFCIADDRKASAAVGAIAKDFKVPYNVELREHIKNFDNWDEGDFTASQAVIEAPRWSLSADEIEEGLPLTAASLKVSLMASNVPFVGHGYRSAS